MTTTTERDGDELVPDGVAEHFVRALRRIEDEGSLDDMVELFDDDAELHRVGHPGTLQGRDGARRFWDGHRASCVAIESRFFRTTATDERVVLEWTARARLHDERSVNVDGVSVLELGAEHLTGFRTYYDTAAFLPRPPARGDTAEGDTAQGDTAQDPEPRAAATLDHTARDSGFLDEDTRRGGQAG